MKGAATAAGAFGMRRSMPGAFARRGVPVVSIGVAVAAIVVALVPRLQHALILDRDLVGSGQLWRIATGSVVHFSASHLAFDLLVVVVAGSLLERSGRALLPVLLASAIAVGTAVLAFAPEIGKYGGLSGVAYAVVMLLGLDGLRTSGLTRWAAIATLLLLAAKLWWEMGSGVFLLVSETGVGFEPVPVAHVAGAVAGMAWFACSWLMRDARALKRTGDARCESPRCSMQ
jgi:rhomboid family GlyGly-CTERM serine protease